MCTERGAASAAAAATIIRMRPHPHAFQRRPSLVPAPAPVALDRQWLRWSILKIAILSLGFAAFLFIVSVALDGLLLHEHESPRLIIEASDLIAGLIAGAAFFLYALKRRRDVTRRLETIDEMNHHIRNALQVIANSQYLPDQHKALEAIDVAVQRIEWALQEVLPKV